jgi:hypothetical protein
MTVDWANKTTATTVVQNLFHHYNGCYVGTLLVQVGNKRIDSVRDSGGFARRKIGKSGDFIRTTVLKIDRVSWVITRVILILPPSFSFFSRIVIETLVLAFSCGSLCFPWDQAWPGGL